MEERRALAFLDLEAGAEDGIIRDIGALREDGAVYHGSSVQELSRFLEGTEILCGHNILHHDMTLLQKQAGLRWQGSVVDTLYLSPLLFPRHPYHALLKDDKLQTGELNNPVNDCRKARILYEDEKNAFLELPEGARKVYAGLLRNEPEFRGVWKDMGQAGWDASGPEMETRVKTALAADLEGRRIRAAKLSKACSERFASYLARGYI